MLDATAKRWTLALTSLAAFIVVLDSQIMTVALSSIRAELHVSLEALQWTVNAYTLTFSVLLLAGAALGDRFGRRRIFVCGIGLFIAASAACALAPDVPALVVARTIQGVGGAMIMPLALTLLSMAFPPAERGKAIGMFNALIGLALIAGPLLGGAITQGISWHAIFWLNVPLGVVAIPMILANIGESKADAMRFDLGGLLLATAAAFAFVWGFVRTGATGWSDPLVIGALGTGAVLLAAFIAWEGRASEPMIPLRLFAIRPFAAGNLTNVLFQASTYALLFFLPQFFQVAQGDGAFGAGARLLPWTATLFVFSPLAGIAIDRFGERGIVVGGLICQGLGTAWIAAIATPDIAYAQLIAPLILTGAGTSCAMPAVQRAIVNGVPRADVGKASGIFTMLRYLGAIFGVAAVASIFGAHGGFATPAAFGAGFTPAMWGAAVLSFAAAVAGLAISPAPHASAVVSTSSG